MNQNFGKLVPRPLFMRYTVFSSILLNHEIVGIYTLFSGDRGSRKALVRITEGILTAHVG
jgi:hypothetical protein